jgi:hypothetical protein
MTKPSAASGRAVVARFSVRNVRADVRPNSFGASYWLPGPDEHSQREHAFPQASVPAATHFPWLHAVFPSPPEHKLQFVLHPHTQVWLDEHTIPVPQEPQ